MKFSAILIVGVTLVAVAGSCASPRRLYKGELRPRGEVAVLKLAANGAITNVNGLKLEGRLFELLPGRYSVGFRTYLRGELVHPGAVGQRERMTCVAEFVAEAGHHYEIAEGEPVLRGGGRKEAGRSMRYYDVQIYVVDHDSNQQPVESTEAVCKWR